MNATAAELQQQEAIDRNVKVGSHVMYVDEHGLHVPAILTAVHGHMSKADRDKNGEQPYPFSLPAVNLVYASPQEDKHDPYGRQLERASSVGHRDSNSVAPRGRFWYILTN